MLFQKATSAISGPMTQSWAKTSILLDQEVELAVVIGDKALNISETEAPVTLQDILAERCQ